MKIFLFIFVILISQVPKIWIVMRMIHLKTLLLSRSFLNPISLFKLCACYMWRSELQHITCLFIVTDTVGQATSSASSAP